MSKRSSRTTSIFHACETLELRTLLAAVNWTGGGDGVNWNNTANWSSNPALPGAADDVTINIGANPTIQLASAQSIRSLVNAESISVNTGGTLTISTTASSSTNITLNGGTVSGGTWTFSGGSGFSAAPVTSNLITGATINGDIFLSSANSRTQIGAGTSFTTAHLSENGTDIGFAPGATVNGTILFEGAAAGARHVTSTSSGTLNIGASGQIRTAAGFGATGNVGLPFWYLGAMTLNNAGTIGSDVNGRTVNIVPNTFTNTGTIRALNGGVLSIQPTTAYSNGGTFNVNASTLNIGGTFNTTAGIGTFTNTAGTVNVVGTINNTGNTLTLNSTTGTWNLLGGTINGGQLSFANSQTLVISPTTSNTLNNLTVNGDLSLTANNSRVQMTGSTTFTNLHMIGDGSDVGFGPGTTLTGNILFEGAAAGGRYVTAASTGTLSIAASGSIRTAAGFGGTGNVGVPFWYLGAMTLNNAGTISSEVASRTINVGPATLTNTNIMRAINGGTLNIGAVTSNWSSSGALSAIDSSTLTLGGTWSNTGSMTITNSTLNLGGAFTTAGMNLAQFTRTGGTVNITGALNNAAATLTLNSVTGSWNLNGGSISGGQLSFAGGAGFSILAMTTNAIANLQINGDITLGVDNARVQISGTTSFANIHMLGNGSDVGFAPGTTITGNILFEGANAGGRYVTATNTGTITVAPGSSIRTVAGFGGSGNVSVPFWYTGAMTLNNQGTISSEVNARTINVAGVALNNTGTARASNGGILNINPSATYTNPGTFDINAGTLNLFGTFNATGGIGTVTNTAGGVVNVIGTITNAGNTLLLNSTTGSWNLLGGTISGGQLSFANGQTLVITPTTSNTLNNLTVNGDLSLVANNSRVQMTGSTTFANLHLIGDGSDVGFSPGYTLTGNILFEGATSGGRYVTMTATGTLNIAASGSIDTVAGFGGHGNVGVPFWYLGVMTLSNAGTIRSDVSGRLVNIGANGVNISGTAQAQSGGLMNVDGAGSATVTASGIANVSRIRQAGSLTIAGSVTILPNGTANAASVVNGLIFNGTGKIDLNDNDLIVEYTGTSPAPSLQASINAARAGGAWNGAGPIQSTAAKNANPKITTLGLLEAIEYKAANGGATSWNGISIDNSAVLIKYTYYGDTDFNGIVNFDDYARTDNGFSTNRTGWLNGDFDGNGTVNFDDYSLIDLAFNTQSGTLRPGRL